MWQRCFLVDSLCNSGYIYHSPCVSALHAELFYSFILVHLIEKKKLTLKTKGLLRILLCGIGEGNGNPLQYSCLGYLVDSRDNGVSHSLWGRKRVGNGLAIKHQQQHRWGI